jgi:hypothetical protein
LVIRFRVVPLQPVSGLPASPRLRLGVMGLAQTASTPGKKTEAQFAGGYPARRCLPLSQSRRGDQQLSGCCQMDLEIGPDGSRMLSCRWRLFSDPIFLEPTVRCLVAQDFVPATRNGQPVRDLQHLEYEWRATTPSKTNLCNKLKTS